MRMSKEQFDDALVAIWEGKINIQDDCQLRVPAATTSASVRRSISCIQQQPTEGVRPNSGKMARSDPRPSVRVTRGAGSGQHLASVLQEGLENANIDAGLGFIWRISVQCCAL